MTDRPTSNSGQSGLPPSNQKELSAASYAGIGLQFVLGIFIFLYLGKWIDSRFGTAPFGILISVFVGSAATFYSVYRRLTAAQRRDDEIHGRTIR